MIKPIYAAFVCVGGTELSCDEVRFLREFNPVGVTLFKRNILNPDQLRKLTDDIRNAVGRPDFLIAIDQEGGTVRRMRPPYWHEYISQQQIATLPENLATRLIELHALLISNDLKQVGINVNFAPVADVLHANTSYILAPRCFSDNPETVARYAKILSDTYINNGICPCIKHLPGHGFAEQDPHIGLSIIKEPLCKLKSDWLPFKKLSKTVPMGMGAHIIIPEIDKKPITQSIKGTDLIRNEINFDGLLLTDAIEMRSLSGSLSEKVTSCIGAGYDVVCFCSGHNQNNPNIVSENVEVLKSAGILSDKSVSRLNKVTSIINMPYKGIDVKTLRSEYDYLVSKTKEIFINKIDGTENWGDKIR